METARSPQLYNPVPYGCVFYLPLWHNEISGTVFSSADDFRHVCTPTGASKASKGFYFDGTDDDIQVNEHAFLKFTTDTWICVWFNPDVVNAEGTLVSKGNISAQDRFILRVLADGTLGGYKESQNDGGIAVTGGAVSATTWQYAEFTFGSGGMDMYLAGGASVANNADTKVLTTGTHAKLSMGENYNNEADLKGYIGEVAIYNRLPVSGERAFRYEQTKGRFL